MPKCWGKPPTKMMVVGASRQRSSISSAWETKCWLILSSAIIESSGNATFLNISLTCTSVTGSLLDASARLLKLYITKMRWKGECTMVKLAVRVFHRKVYWK